MIILLDKSAVLRKLNSQFSYLRTEIPQTVNVDGKTINLKGKLDEIIEAAENQDLSKVMPEMLELREILEKSLADFIIKVQDSKTEPSEAASQLEYYLGIKRAIQIIKGFSEGSLKPFRKTEETESEVEDEKRWLDYVKHLQES